MIGIPRTGTRRPAVSIGATPKFTAADGFALEAAYSSEVPTSMKINGKDYSFGEGRIFHAFLKEGKVIVRQFPITGDRLKGGDWNIQRRAALVKTIPELQPFLGDPR
jgi:hypothetical protein